MRTCEECQQEYDACHGGRTRIWPPICDSCLAARQPQKHAQAPYVDFGLPEKLRGYNPQLGRFLNTRKDQQQAIRDIEAKANGQVKLEWH